MGLRLNRMEAGLGQKIFFHCPADGEHISQVLHHGDDGDGGDNKDRCQFKAREQKLDSPAAFIGSFADETGKGEPGGFFDCREVNQRSRHNFSWKGGDPCAKFPSQGCAKVDDAHLPPLPLEKEGESVAQGNARENGNEFEKALGKNADDNYRKQGDHGNGDIDLSHGFCCSRQTQADGHNYGTDDYRRNDALDGRQAH